MQSFLWFPCWSVRRIAVFPVHSLCVSWGVFRFRGSGRRAPVLPYTLFLAAWSSSDPLWSVWPGSTLHSRRVVGSHRSWKAPLLAPSATRPAESHAPPNATPPTPPPQTDARCSAAGGRRSGRRGKGRGGGSAELIYLSLYNCGEQHCIIKVYSWVTECLP